MSGRKSKRTSKSSEIKMLRKECVRLKHEIRARDLSERFAKCHRATGGAPLNAGMEAD